MSGGGDEKQAARARREAAEQEATLAASRKRRLAIVGGGVAAAALVTGVVFAFTSGKDASPEPAGAGLPAQQETDLKAAAAAAKATFSSYDYDYGTGAHVTGKVKYPMNPPTNGPHFPVCASDGNYAGVATPPTERLVHALEHGRIEIQYRADLPAAQLKQLVALYDEDPRHVLLFENQTKMPAAVAVTAWAHGLLMTSFTPASIDAIRAFRDTYRDKAPELVP